MFPLQCITYPWLLLNILARLWIQRGGGMNQSCLLAFLILKHLMNWINVWQFLLQTAQWCIWSFPKKQLGFTETCNLIRKKWMLLRLILFFYPTVSKVFYVEPIQPVYITKKAQCFLEACGTIIWMIENIWDNGHCGILLFKTGWSEDKELPSAKSSIF